MSQVAADPVPAVVRRRNTDPGSRDWCELTVEMLRDFWGNKKCADQSFHKTVDELQVAHAWKKLGAKNLDALLRREIGWEGAQAARAYLAHGGDRKSPRFKAMAKDQGGNAHLKGKGSTERNLARLRRDRPDLAEKVEAKELTSNAAAVEAGFRKPTLSVPLDSMPGLAECLYRHLTLKQRIEFVDVVSHWPLTAPTVSAENDGIK